MSLGQAVGLFGPLLFFLAGLVLIAIGLAVLVRLARRLLLERQYQDSEPVSPDEAPDGGYATVVGRAGAGPDGLLVAPFSGREAIAYRYEIEQYTDGVGWWRVAEGGDVTDFDLEGQTQRTLVRVDDVDPDVDGTELEVTVDEGDSLPAELRERLDAHSTFDLGATPQILASAVDDRRRYRETVVEPGDELNAFGTCATGEGSFGSTLDVAGSTGGVVSTDPPGDATVDAPHRVSEIAGTVGGAIGFIAVGTFFLHLVGPTLLAALQEVLGP